jgi:hypothetical protein
MVMTTPDVPPEVLAMLSGRPATGEWEAMYPMLTVDDTGFPHVCLLSRAELNADRRNIYAVLASPQTIVNVRRTGKITLITFGADTATYLKLRITESVEDKNLFGIICKISSVKRDTLHIPLRPPQYLVTDALPETEDWARSARVMTQLAARAQQP